MIYDLLLIDQLSMGQQSKQNSVAIQYYFDPTDSKYHYKCELKAMKLFLYL